MRSDWVSEDVFKNVLAALMPVNKLAIIVSLVSGLRIDDVLNMRASELLKERFTVTEKKTLKRRTVRLPVKLREELIKISGRIYVFEGRLDPKKPRSRQAVYKDIKRAAKAFRIKKINVCPHSARKIYAVQEYKKDMNIKRVKELLNHSSEAVTMIYALADEISAKKH